MLSTPSHPATRLAPEPRTAYHLFRRIDTRWADNDAYGHVNNVVYYAWFDTAVNAHLIEQGALDIHDGSTIGLVVETHCNYFSPVVFPEQVEIGLRIADTSAALIGSSVRYELGVFKADAYGKFEICAAKGHFIHVYVDQQTRRPVQLPLILKTVLEKINNV
jgi:acyl-CoA thioester hydrolase